MTAPATGKRDEFAHILLGRSATDPRTARELLPLVYDELRRLAARRLPREVRGETALEVPAETLRPHRLAAMEERAAAETEVLGATRAGDWAEDFTIWE